MLLEQLLHSWAQQLLLLLHGKMFWVLVWAGALFVSHFDPGNGRLLAALDLQFDLLRRLQQPPVLTSRGGSFSQDIEAHCPNSHHALSMRAGWLKLLLLPYSFRVRRIEVLAAPQPLCFHSIFRDLLILRPRTWSLSHPRFLSACLSRGKWSWQVRCQKGKMGEYRPKLVYLPQSVAVKCSIFSDRIILPEWGVGFLMGSWRF